MGKRDFNEFRLRQPAKTTSEIESGHLDPAGSAAYLRKIVAVSEGIKEVVSLSMLLNLTAINAMLTARRAGERVLGFRVVSHELRVFSRRLEGSMAEINRMIARMVRDIAFMQKVYRAGTVMERAARKSAASEALLAESISLKQRELHLLRQATDRNWGELCVRLRHAERLCQDATVLARSAKIEAVYGGQMAATLNQVAGNVENEASAIIEKMKRLNAEVLG